MRFEEPQDTLVDDVGRQHELHLAAAPRLEDPAGRSGNEYWRKEYAGIEDDSHRSRRNVPSASATSGRSRRARRACLRASASNSSN